jgi:hypothetical protein
VHHLSSDSESESAEKQDKDDRSEIYAAVGRAATWQEQVIIPNLKFFSGANSEVKHLQTVLVFLEDFLEICTNICSRKLLVVANESKSIQLGNAELKRKGIKCANVQMPLKRVNISRDMTHSTSTRTFGKQFQIVGSKFQLERQ